MKRNSENGVGEPGQFKTTPVVGFTPIDRTPTKSPSVGVETRKGRSDRKAGSAKKSTAAGSAERELKKRVLRHRRKGLSDN